MKNSSRSLAKSILCSLRRKKNVLTGIVVVGSFVFGTAAEARIETVIGSQDLQTNPNLPGFFPSVTSDEIIISRPQYIISYNRERRAPNWVAWRVDASKLGFVQRSNHFQLDTELQDYLDAVDLRSGSKSSVNSEKKAAVSPTEYKRSCFDRGHQSPSGDHTSTPADNEATFMMSNMIPQTAYLNRVIWEHLEEHTRDLVKQENKIVYVVAGPIYDKDFGSIGPAQDIPVPSKNFKMLLVLDQDVPVTQILRSAVIVSVIMPNVLADGTEPTNQALLCSQSIDINSFAKDDWEKYQVPLKTIESVAGIILH